MKINLIPISHSDLDTIEIDSDDFLIGRLEEPFISFNAEITADMSRRHAKIFTENGQVCIVDLQSLNGTTLNDLTLGTKPLPVNDGDVIEFAKYLAYKIEFVAPEPDETLLSAQTQEISLTLEPVNINLGLDILVITGFPFLISKEAGVFASFQKEFASETSRISRRHAYVLLEKDELQLIDMSSTNGTYINNTQVDDVTPATLKNGDIVSFAGDFFTYIVKLNSTNKTDIDATVVLQQKNNVSESEEKEDNTISGIEPKTTFVNEPSPFLDILCNEVISNRNPEVDTDKESDADDNKKSSQKKLSFAVSFIQQCWSAIADENPNKNKIKTYSIIFAVICIASATAYLYLNDNTREIKQLINSGQYDDAATLSIKLLKDNPENSTLKVLSTKAILNTIMPFWLENIQEHHYKEAKQTLQNARQYYLSAPDIVSSLTMLQWVANMHQFISTRNKNGGIEIFADENKIQTLLTSWNINRKQNRKTLAMIARNVSVFKPYYEQVLSDVRSLENDQDLYLKAINTLKSQILEQLQADQTQELSNTVIQFEKRYTAITGLDELKLDIYHYIELYEAVSNKNIESIASIRKKNQFKTPLFIEFSKQKFSEQLPSDQFTKLYSEAIQSWKVGEADAAINQLLSLSKSNWGSSAQTKLERYQAVVTEFSTLNNAKGSEHYVDNLFNFYTLLKLPEDNHFLKKIESDLQNHAQIAKEKAQNNFEQAQIYWTQYTDNNGIGGLLRLENNISSAFTAQAENLSTAYLNINYCMQIYKNLHIDAPNSFTRMAQKIENEMVKQRKWLIDLELILKPETLKKKLDLLILPEDQ